ncbi:MAG: hypothetical protein HQL58_11495, partial [Magnetococcales bacterium]|nr:hypothetical protein [Magnetococcales bacterium]
MLTFAFPVMFYMAMPVAAGWAGEPLIIRDEGFSLELMALPLDAVEAFFLARGFAPTASRMIADKGCVHKLAAAHDASTDERSVTVDLAAWRVRTADLPWRPLVTKETWAQSWQKMAVPRQAQIAFQSLSPNERETRQLGRADIK